MRLFNRYHNLDKSKKEFSEYKIHLLSETLQINTISLNKRDSTIEEY